jgi:hypothetical protein
MRIQALTGRPLGLNSAEETDRSITLYVDSAGDDTNDGLTLGAPLSTIQAAIDKIPKFVNDPVTCTNIYI